MKYEGKFKILKSSITMCDYTFVLREIKKAIENKKSLLISPVASQTITKAYFDRGLNNILDSFDLLVPDSQWLRLSFLFLYGKYLKDRVYGPHLMILTLKLAARFGIEIYLYGNTQKTLEILAKKLKMQIPELLIAGFRQSKFRRLNKTELADLKNDVIKSNAKILFISLGSPLQEIFSYRFRKQLNSPIIFIPVGAAFDFIAGTKRQAPPWIQKLGFEWSFRLLQEPFRLWKRYLFYGPLFIFLVLKQRFVGLNTKKIL